MGYKNDASVGDLRGLMSVAPILLCLCKYYAIGCERGGDDVIRLIQQIESQKSKRSASHDIMEHRAY